ncbi:MAG: hypothetical protein QNL77_12235 [Akkermansiaceae bacterium]
MKKFLSTLITSTLLLGAAQAGVVWTHDFTSGEGFVDGALSGQNGFVGHSNVGTSAQIDTTAGIATTTGNWLGNSKNGSGSVLAPGDWVEVTLNLTSTMAFNDPAGANLANTDLIRVGFSDYTQTFPGSVTNGVSGKLRFGQWYNAGHNANSGVFTVSANDADTANTDVARLLGVASDIGIHGQAGASQDLTLNSLKLTYRATMGAVAGDWALSLNLFNNTTSTDLGTHAYDLNVPTLYTAAQAGELRGGFRTLNINNINSVGLVLDDVTFSENIAPIPEPSAALLSLIASALLLRRKR